MEELCFTNSTNDVVYYEKWETKNPRACVVISHGMAENIERYDDFAKFLNANGIEVYGINQVGHGTHATKLGHMGKNDFDKCVSNLDELILNVRKVRSCKVYLLGHSMGSFVAQLYSTRFHNIDGLLLSGSNHSNAITKVGAVVVAIINFFKIHKDAPSPLCNNLSFASYNKSINNPRTDFDWLTKDEAIVDAYIASPLCGYCCSSYFFKNLTSGINKMNKEKNMRNIQVDLPIYVQGGEDDPVSNYGAGLKTLYAHYQKLGIKDVKLTLYPNDRHEILNETDKDVVYNNTLNWLNERI